jgi:DNA-binding response OmpR family regulator
MRCIVSARSSDTSALARASVRRGRVHDAENLLLLGIGQLQRRIGRKRVLQRTDRRTAVGPLMIWPRKRAARCGADMRLTGAAFNILHVLALNAGRPVSKKDLSHEALGRPLARYDRTIDVHLSSIRKSSAAARISYTRSAASVTSSP